MAVDQRGEGEGVEPCGHGEHGDTGAQEEPGHVRGFQAADTRAQEQGRDRDHAEQVAQKQDDERVHFIAQVTNDRVHARERKGGQQHEQQGRAAVIQTGRHVGVRRGVRVGSLSGLVASDCPSARAGMQNAP